MISLINEEINYTQRVQILGSPEENGEPKISGKSLNMRNTLVTS